MPRVKSPFRFVYGSGDGPKHNRRFTTARMLILYDKLDTALGRLVPMTEAEAVEAPEARAAADLVAFVNLLARDARRCLSRLPEAKRVRLLETDGSATRRDAARALEQIRAALAAFPVAYGRGKENAEGGHPVR